MSAFCLWKAEIGAGMNAAQHSWYEQNCMSRTRSEGMAFLLRALLFKSGRNSASQALQGSGIWRFRKHWTIQVGCQHMVAFGDKADALFSPPPNSQRDFNHIFLSWPARLSPRTKARATIRPHT